MDMIRWPVNQETFYQLGMIFAVPKNPISIFNTIQNIPKEAVTPNSDILREKGIKDALGNLSPTFRRALSVLADPDGLVRIKIISDKQEKQWTVYFGKDLTNRILYSILPDESFLVDPFDLDDQLMSLRNWVGSSSIKNHSYELLCSQSEALVFASLFDLHAKSHGQELFSDGFQGVKKFTKEEILSTIEVNWSNDSSLVGNLPYQSPIEASNLEIQQPLASLVESGFCQIKEDSYYSLPEAQLAFINNFFYIDQIIKIDLRRLHRTSGQITTIQQTYLQNGLRNILSIEYQENKVHFRSITAIELAEQFTQIVEQGITQIPDPQPLITPASSTVIMSQDEIVWQLLPKDSDRPITISNITRIGRHPNNQIVITEPSISRWHAQIELRSGECTITDLGSSNGTFVNGKKIQTPTSLRNSDSIQVGPITYILISQDLSILSTEKHTSVPENIDQTINASTSSKPDLNENKPIPPAKFCPGCGRPARSGAKYCDQCGTQIIL